MKLVQIHNIHTHIFTIHHVPSGFLPFNLVTLFKIDFFSNLIKKAFGWLAILTKKDGHDRHLHAQDQLDLAAQQHAAQKAFYFKMSPVDRKKLVREYCASFNKSVIQAN